MFIKKEKLIARIKAKITKAEKKLTDHEKKFPAFRSESVKYYKAIATKIAKAKDFEEVRRWPWAHAPQAPYLDYGIERDLKTHRKQLAVLESIVEEEIEIDRFSHKLGLDGMFDD